MPHALKPILCTLLVCVAAGAGAQQGYSVKPIRLDARIVKQAGVKID